MKTAPAEMSDPDVGGAATDSDAGRPILFFDGVCGLCNRSVDFVLARDRRKVFRFAPLQGETAARTLKLDPQNPLDTIVLRVGNRSHERSAAAVRVLWRLGGFCKLLGGLLWLIPLPLRNLGYRIIARYRYRWFGKHETCRLPTADERDRFLP